MAAQGMRASRYPMLDMAEAQARVCAAVRTLLDMQHEHDMRAQTTRTKPLQGSAETSSITAGAAADAAETRGGRTDVLALCDPVCMGAVLAADVLAAVDVPAYTCSRLDGYAVLVTPEHPVRAGDVLHVVGSCRAADTAVPALGAGQAVWVTTGARVPEHTTAVLAVEMTRAGEHGGVPGREASIVVLSAPMPGDGLRPAGSDWHAGDIVLRAGHTLGARDAAALLSVGVTHVTTRKRVRVGVLSTGNEIAEPFPQTPRTDAPSTLDSNRTMLMHMVRECGGEPLDLGIVRDEAPAIRAALLAAGEHCDVCISTGGVSMGDHDFVKPVLEEIGDLLFGRLNMKPGKPATAALVRRADKPPLLAFALPGNPVSAWVCMHVLVAPALKRLSGRHWDTCDAPTVHATLLDTVTLDPERPEYHRCIVWFDAEFGGLRCRSTGSQASSRLASTVHANALAWIPAGTGKLEAPARVHALLVGPIESAAALPKDFRDERISNNISGHGCGCSHARPVGSASPTPPLDVPGPHPSMSHAAASVAQSVSIFKFAVLTVSDRCATGAAEDKSGPAIQRHMTASTWAEKQVAFHLHAVKIVPDEADRIFAVAREWVSQGVELVLVTGGTGFSPRDITPEALRPLLVRPAPGLVHAMYRAGLEHTPMAVLSRYEAGLTADGRTLFMEMPGSPKAVIECLDAIGNVLPHALKLMRSA